MSYILCTISGKETQIAISEDLASFGESVVIDTDRNFKKGIKDIADTVQKLTNEEIRGMVVGFSGVLNDDKTSVVSSDDTAMSAWLEEPVVEELKKKLKTEVWLENSTALSALGEALHGAGEGYAIVAYHSIGASVDGARIDDGEIDGVAHSFEPGQQILDIDQTILGEEAEPTLENLVSEKALMSRTGEKPAGIPQGDAVWDQLAEYLSFGLHNTVTYWSPDVIVLGGSMIVGEPKILIDSIITHLHAIAGDMPVPDIVDADLNDKAALYGAMALLNQKV